MPGGYTDRGLKALIKALSAPPAARIGVLAGTKNRGQQVSEALNRGAGRAELKRIRAATKKSAGIPTNAEVGAAHEYGAPARGLPARSWLRVPLIDHMAKEIEKNPPLARATFQRAARDGTLMKFLSMIGVMGERVVRIGFTNNGYGKWADLSPKRALTKTVKNTLVETTQLREAVTHVVVGKGK